MALSAACLLAVGLIYTSFSASSEARSPSDLLRDAEAGKSYQVTGKVAEGSIRREGTTWDFRVRDRTGHAAVPVRYVGSMPDPFREGREVVVDVKRQGGTWVASKVVTKCPSKFTADKKDT